MRIGLLTTSFPRYEHDIAGAFVLGFARALVEQGHRIEVLAPEPREAIQAPAWPNIAVHWVPYMRPRSLARTFYGAGVPDNLRRDPLAWLGVAPFALALLEQALTHRARWDAVVSHWALPCGLVAAAVRQARPHLAVVHSADLHLLSRLPMRNALAAQLARESTHILFVSQRQRTQFASMLDGSGAAAELRARCEVQPMGIELGARPSPNDASAHASLAERDVLRRRLGLDRFTLLTIARLVPVKGLFEAVRQLGAREDLEWLIAGDGPERERLAALASQTGLRVRLLGTVTGDAKRDLLRAADAFVLPSRVLPSGRSEGAPTVLLEAMAHELPIIASNVGGIGELVAHMRSGLLFDPDAHGNLATCVERVRTDRALAVRLVEQARTVVDGYDWNRIAPRLDRMLRERAVPIASATVESDAVQRDATRSR